MRRLSIDEAFFEDAKSYLVDPEQEVQITTQQSPTKLNEIDIDMFDFKTASEQQLIKQLSNDYLDSERAQTDFLASNSSIKYTEE